MNETKYEDYIINNEDNLKENFVMQFSRAELHNFVLDCCNDVECCSDADFFIVHEDSFESYCREQYELEQWGKTTTYQW